MERRSAIRQLFLLSVGVSLLPSCMSQPERASMALKNIELTKEQEELIGEIAETIIPATDTPGAKELGIHLFVIKMIDDCYDKAAQKQFIEGLKAFEADDRMGKLFIGENKTERIKMLDGILKNPSGNKAIISFLKETRKQTIKGFTFSELFMTKIVPYQLVPGRFDGCVKISNS